MSKKFLYLLLTLITLPLVIFVTTQIQRILSRASSEKADILIDTQNPVGPLDKDWLSFSQGGEEPPPMLTGTVGKMRSIGPKYIRLDHIYDYYQIIKKRDNGYDFDFSKLDATVNDILAMGALPFFSLTYMPAEFTNSGKVIDMPRDWNNWKDLVKATIERYSGKSGKNLEGVYYEVWNEPELPQFGSWKMGGEKDYRLLYYHGAWGAKEAANTNKFFFGGPGVGSYYPAWIKDLLSYAAQNQLRLDFYSWHRYHTNPDVFVSDAKQTRALINNFTQFKDLPIILTEWGIESDNKPINTTSTAAAFNIVTIAKIQNLINMAFSFEVKNGPPPGGGKWGLISHENDTPPLMETPRYKAYEVLNQLSGNKLKLTGDNKYINGLASGESEDIKVVLANYDLTGNYTADLPVTFTGLRPGSYQLNYSYLLSKNQDKETNGSFELITTTGSMTKNFILPANNILYLSLKYNSPLAQFVSGAKSVNNKDKSLILSNTAGFTLTPPEFTVRPRGNISLEIKPLWSNDKNAFFILEIPYSTQSGQINRLFLAKESQLGSNFLTWGISSNKVEQKVSQNIDNWQINSWHKINLGWSEAGLSMSIDENPLITTDTSLDIRNGNLFTIYPIKAAMDNLLITLGNDQIIKRSFDDNVEN